MNQLTNELSVSNVVEEKDNYNARCIFSTYQTMIHLIDDAKDEDGKIFSSGHFDLVICDEAHRSIYNKYKDIFNYFDALLIGLTATPKEDIDKNTYSVFELEDGVPTYGYELAQAVKDGYLVDYLSVESKLKFIEQGIIYNDLSQEDKEAYEDTFEDENGKLPESIEASAINTWLFNEDTIKQVLHILMTEGLKIGYGEKLGKTIIFAKNHDHAEKILERILWSEIGTKEDYQKEYGVKPLGEFVREIVGLDMNAAKEAFAEFLNNTSLDSRQIYFVNQIVEYIVHNGLLKDLSVLQESPFTDRGSVAEIFTDMDVWIGIRKVIDKINENAVA